jgi:hypothetical protein
VFIEIKPVYSFHVMKNLLAIRKARLPAELFIAESRFRVNLPAAPKLLLIAKSLSDYFP